MDISNKDFEGDTPKIGAIVGLKLEKIAMKVQFDTFCEKVADFILTELLHGMDVVGYVKDMTDPMPAFVNKFLPKELIAAEKRSDIKQGIFNQQLKKYVDRENLLYDNKIKLYTYIWGQCSSRVKSVIMGDATYKEKDDRKDVLWLLQKSN